jgi:biotin operon repressor
VALKTSAKEAKRRLAALEKTKSARAPTGSVTAAAKLLGMTPNAMSRWLLNNGVVVGNVASHSKEECIRVVIEMTQKLGRPPTREELKATNLKSAWRTHWNNLRDFLAAAAVVAPLIDDQDKLVRLLRSAPTLDVLATKLSVSRGKALDLVDGLKAKGFNVFQRGDRFSLEAVPMQVEFDEALHRYDSDEKGRYRFGVVTDNHLCSKYAREDVLHDLYDWFEREGITRVYNAGNWIDGEARFNRHDLLVHGMDAQLKYFAERYPKRDGITTYYVAGDDHEGWYAKDAGVDIGLRAQQTAEKMGRKDLRYLGYMEAYIRLRHAVTGKEAQLLVVHPGGGSSYAISYAPQKFVEALQGGEKPAVVIFGHWHKMDCFNYRNVWIYQGGTTEDQTPFMRKKKLEAHVGGGILELGQDEFGAINLCVPNMKRYFDRGYYNGQFNMAGDISRPIRAQ